MWQPLPLAYCDVQWHQLMHPPRPPHTNMHTCFRQVCMVPREMEQPDCQLTAQQVHPAPCWRPHKRDACLQARHAAALVATSLLSTGAACLAASCMLCSFICTAAACLLLLYRPGWGCPCMALGERMRQNVIDTQPNICSAFAYAPQLKALLLLHEQRFYHWWVFERRVAPLLCIPCDVHLLAWFQQQREQRSERAGGRLNGRATLWVEEA